MGIPEFCQESLRNNGKHFVNPVPGGSSGSQGREGDGQSERGLSEAAAGISAERNGKGKLRNRVEIHQS